MKIKPAFAISFGLFLIVATAKAGPPTPSCERSHSRAQSLCNPDAHRIEDPNPVNGSPDALARARTSYSTLMLKRYVACAEAQRGCEDECAKAQTSGRGATTAGTAQMYLLECSEGSISSHSFDFERASSFSIQNAKTYAQRACAFRNGRDGREKSEFCEDETRDDSRRSYRLGSLSPAPVPGKGRDDVGPPSRGGRVFGIQFTIPLNSSGAP